MIDTLLDVLAECADFLDRYADYTTDEYGRPEPNDAARLLYDVQRAIDDAEAGKL